MLDIKGLKLRIPGKFNDAFLYGLELFLLDDDLLYIVDYKALIDSIAPKDPESRLLAHYAFHCNSFFYKADSVFHDFFNLSRIKNILFESFKKLESIKLNPSKLMSFVTSKVSHNHPGAYHLEIYNHTIFISSDLGVYSYKLVNGILKYEKVLLEFPAYHITASMGNNVYMSCGEQGIMILYLGNLYRRATINVEYQKHIDNNAVFIDMAYTDLVVRKLDSSYSFQLDTSISKKIKRSSLSSVEKLQGYRQLNNILPGDVKILAANRNKLLSVIDNTVGVYMYNYSDRKDAPDSISTADLYSNSYNWTIPLKIGDIYDGYQTVFGLILDTEFGTVVIDDSFDTDSDISAYSLSRGENVKLRYYYRSVNYSHVLVNIKNNYIDIYSDLTNYFIPPEQRKLRRLITSRQARAEGSDS